MARLITTLGDYEREDLAMILPHEHVFVDLRTPDQPGYAEADPHAVVALMAPRIEEIKALGVTALVECSTGGVGLRVDIDLAVSKATDFPIVVPTGNYREPWIPQWVREADDAELEAYMLGHLTEGIGDTGVKAAWIKLSAGDDGMTPLEQRILKAAARAGKATSALIGSHTIKGRVALDQIAVIEEQGYSANRYLWIHTQEEPDFALHREVAGRGAWIEYDCAGRWEDEKVVDLILRALEAGLGDRLLLSHDLGWFDPAIEGGGTPKPYTRLSAHILPMLRAKGIGEETLTRLTHTNPFNAFAR